MGFKGVKLYRHVFVMWSHSVRSRFSVSKTAETSTKLRTFTSLSGSLFYLKWKLESIASDRRCLRFIGTIFFKNRQFIIQERFNKLIYGTDTTIKCGTLQPVKFQLVSRFWTGWKMKWFYRISELMLESLIQRYDKIVSVLIQFKNKWLIEILQAVRCHFLWSY